VCTYSSGTVTSSGTATSSGTVTFTAPGTCVIDANEGGNADYLPAQQAQQSVTVVSSGLG